MSSQALILIVITWSSVTFATVYFFWKVLKTPPKPEQDSEVENSEKE